MSDKKRYYCFPDIHGRFDLLQKALTYVYQENPNGGKIIFLGDYIDRGPDNVKVLLTIMNPPKNWEFIPLMGNHEAMFRDAVITSGRCRYYDAWPLLEISNSPDLTVDQVVDWIKTLPLFHFEDDNVFAHATYDPNLPGDQQLEHNVVWHRYNRGEPYQSSKYYLTHGHTPEKDGPIMTPNRCNMDAGGVFYGRYVIGEYLQGRRGPYDIHQFECIENAGASDI